MEGGVGCYGGYRTITTKRNAMAESLKASLRGSTRDVAENLTNLAKNIAEKPCGRNHSEEGCSSDVLDWSQCKYNDIDDKIKDME